MVAGALRTQNVTKVYGESAAAVHALRGVDLDVRKGELVDRKSRS